MTRRKPRAGRHVLAQFPAGLGALVRESLAADLPDLHVDHADDSALLFTTSAPLDALAGLTYVKNAYLVLARRPRPSGEGRHVLDSGARALAAALRRDPRALRAVPRRRPFRVMASLDGRLTAFDRRARSSLESVVTEVTGGRVETRGSGEELWLLGRTGLRDLLLALRLRPPAGRPEAVRGSLSPELAALLVRASQPRDDDTFLDPMAGRGALVAARARFPAGRLLYNDLALGDLRGRLPAELRRSGSVRFLAEDATALPSVADDSVDALVTDPPWGEHDSAVDPAALAPQLADTFARVVHPERGRVVVLVSRRTARLYASALAGVGLSVGPTIDVLVNGHPATVLRSLPGDRLTRKDRRCSTP